VLEKLLRAIASPEAKILAAKVVGDNLLLEVETCLGIIRGGTFSVIDRVYLTLACRATAIQLTKNSVLRNALAVPAIKITVAKTLK
jgi:hypothetical protein